MCTIDARLMFDDLERGRSTGMNYWIDLLRLGKDLVDSLVTGIEK